MQSKFDLLHPALQHHIVNSLGWTELRPFQEAVIRPILADRHMLVVAPTAGGKTEAALFPVLSRMLNEDWRRLSLLYICPIKALLNNLDIRLNRYFGLIGRRSALWHGDISPTVRKHILRNPPDCLLTTPESLEVMLTSRNVDHRTFLADARVVIIDEIHAFAGDDRGWHLLAVLERISKIAEREIQRIGLSATVGNPDGLAQWLRGGGHGAYEIQQPAETDRGGLSADVTVDFVGSLDNAAIVISRLHRGEKRLVFTDSRAKAERLGAELRRLDVAVFVTHSSLSPDQRRQAEHAFAERDDCVIVATSVLELGIDVGDLDRTIQIDAPAAVNSFLQRMGRTGRRTGTKRNYLFLATSDESVLHACALVRLWETGYVEPLTPPSIPYHVFAQQLMALSLQESGIGANAWKEWIGGFCQAAGLRSESLTEIVDFMVEEDLLWNDEGMIWFGRKGEQTFGYRHFMEILSMVADDPLFKVMHGREVLGVVHPMSFTSTKGEAAVILLAGRSWAVRHIDWNRKIAYVEAATQPGRSQWIGSGISMHFEICQAIRELIQSNDASPFWSRRTSEKIDEIRDAMSWLEHRCTQFEIGRHETRWWTFAGERANRTLCRLLKDHIRLEGQPGSLAVLFRDGLGGAKPAELVETIQFALDWTDIFPVDDEFLDGLKFSRCLPRRISERIIVDRFYDLASVRKILKNGLGAAIVS
jgi:ATP-dependent helicase Lhr and Lhr-like helicase